jgi:hypothetical protein
MSFFLNCSIDGLLNDLAIAIFCSWSRHAGCLIFVQFMKMSDSMSNPPRLHIWPIGDWSILVFWYFFGLVQDILLCAIILMFFFCNSVKVFNNNYRPKDVKCLMAKIRKEPKSIETTGIRKAMKEVQAKARKAHRLGVTVFCK